MLISPERLGRRLAARSLRDHGRGRPRSDVGIATGRGTGGGSTITGIAGGGGSRSSSVHARSRSARCRRRVRTVRPLMTIRRPLERSATSASRRRRRSRGGPCARARRRTPRRRPGCTRRAPRRCSASIARIGHRDRRARHHHAAGEQPREHALDAARHAAQDAVVDVIERQADELRDEQARIAAAHLQRAGGAQPDRLTGRRQHEARRHVERDLDRRGQHEVRGRPAASDPACASDDVRDRASRRRSTPGTSRPARRPRRPPRIRPGRSETARRRRDGPTRRRRAR